MFPSDIDYKVVQEYKNLRLMTASTSIIRQQGQLVQRHVPSHLALRHTTLVKAQVSIQLF